MGWSLIPWLCLESLTTSHNLSASPYDNLSISSTPVLYPHSRYPSNKLSTFNFSYTCACAPPTQLLPTNYQLLIHQCSIHTALTLPQSIIISYTRAPPTNPLPRAHKSSTFNFSHTSAPQSINFMYTSDPPIQPLPLPQSINFTYTREPLPLPQSINFSYTRAANTQL